MGYRDITFQALQRSGERERQKEMLKQKET